MTATVSRPSEASAPHPSGSPADRTTQGAARIHDALEKITHPRRIDPVLTAAGIISWVAFGVITIAVPNSAKLSLRDVDAVENTTAFTAIVGFGVAAVAVVTWLLAARPGRVGAIAGTRVSRGAAWLLGSGLWAIFWQLSTAKTQILATPYFAAPQQIFDRLWNDRGILAESIGNSLLLLTVGFVAGLVAGLATGLVIGWWQTANYWVHPILMFLGPVPALAWVPIVFVLSPNATSGALFLIALSVWFPITVLTRSGITSVPRSYYDVTQTLGAGNRFLILRVSLPAALPSIFTGAFMALGASFVSLTIAENFGVNSGLGWYLNWKKSWGDYPAVYAGIVILIVICGLLLSALFRLRGWALRWEKDVTRW